MSEQRVLVIENPARLCIDTGRLKIERDGFDNAFVMPADISILCLEHHTVTLSVAVLRMLAEAGSTVLVTDARHLPCSMLYPLAATGLGAGRLRQQIALDASSKRAELWQHLVATKLFTQAHVLRELGRHGALRLERLASKVQPDDSGNIEAQGSRLYWNNLFPSPFRRIKEGATDLRNIQLNYGYAVLRAMIARSLSSAGLNNELGLGHCNAANAFNLADDFIEPYRFVVDIHLAQNTDNWEKQIAFDTQTKRSLLCFIKRSIRIAGQDMRLHAAIDATVASYVRILEGRQDALVLPNGLSVSDGKPWASMDGA